VGGEIGAMHRAPPGIAIEQAAGCFLSRRGRIEELIEPEHQTIGQHGSTDPQGTVARQLIDQSGKPSPARQTNNHYAGPIIG
jgi:hypothetical protein